jgi:hypothetical protein
MSRLRAFFNPPTSDSLRAPTRIFWVGFVVRVLYMTLAHTYRFRTFGDHFEFGWEMGRIARALATGHGFADPFNGHSGPTAWTPPLYPLIIAACFKVFGVYSLLSSWMVLAVNSIFSAATAPAIYRIGWRSFGRDKRGMSIALWSAWLWALYPAAMQYAVKWVWDMSLTAFLFAWMIVLALKLRGVGESSELSFVSSQRQAEPIPATPSKASLLRTENSQLGTKESQLGTWAAFGLVWGLIALSNSSLLTFLPFCGMWIIWPSLRTGTHFSSALRNAALAAVCFLAVISPWVARNWTVFHAFVPMRSNFGAELYQATILENDGFPWGATLPMAEKAPEFQRYERMGEIAYSKAQGERAKAAIRAHPRPFLRNTVRRVYFFWFSVPHSLDAGILVEAIRRFNFSFFSITGWLGLILALRRRIPGAWLFFWAFAALPFIYYFVTVQARFRHPLEPLICVLSVYLFQSADRTRMWSRPKPSAG